MEVSHLGRACAGAYRGKYEHGGGLGVEKGPLTRPAASGGALADNGAAAELLLLLHERAEKKRESGRGQNGAWGRGVLSRPG